MWQSRLRCGLLILLYTLGVVAEETTILTPQIRESLIPDVKYRLETASILPYLENLIVLESRDDLDKLPYVLGYEAEQYLGGGGDEAFVVGIGTTEFSSYSFVRLGKTLKDPITKEHLGTTGSILGEGMIKRFGKPSVLSITNAKMPIERGERLVPRVALELPEVISAKIIKQPMQGYIIQIYNGIWEAGEHQVVVINLGEREGMKQGGLLNIVHSGDTRSDPRVKNKTRQLPAIPFGEIMIYKVFEKLSLGLILSIDEPVEVMDQVVTGVV